MFNWTQYNEILLANSQSNQLTINFQFIIKIFKNIFIGVIGQSQ